MTTEPLARLVRTFRDTLDADAETDVALLARLRAGRDPVAADAIVHRHGRRVLAACRKVLGADAEAEDAFQATFLVLLGNPGAVRRTASLGAWLYGVAHRIALQARAHRARRSGPAAADLPAPPALPWQEACAILHEELDRLPDAVRLPLVLCYLDGVSRDEAAQQLGRTLNSVKKALETGRERLRARLVRRGVTLSAGLLAAVAEPVAADPPPDLTTPLIAGAVRPAAAALARTVRTGVRFRSLGLGLAAGLLVVGVALGFPKAPPGDPPAKEMPAKPATKQAAPPVDGPKGERITFAGRVLDPEGKAVKGAKVSLVNASESRDDPPLRPSATAEADGRFSFEVPKPESFLFDFFHPTLVAWADGFGVGLLPANQKGSADAEVRLFPDLPVRGRILNPAGKPLAGATVRVVKLGSQPAPDLAAWVKEAQGPGLKELGRDPIFDNLPQRVTFLTRSLPGLPAASTDRDGGFTLSGIGRERVAALSISGPGVVTSEVLVVTQPGPAGQFKLIREAFQGKGLNETGEPRIPATTPAQGSTSPRSTGTPVGDPETARHPFYRVPFDHVMTPEQPVEGRVTDKETGEPVPGVRVETWSPTGEIVQTLTDKDGRYRVGGLPPGSHQFDFKPGPDTPYHKRSGAGGKPDSIRPARLDVVLLRAPWVRGCVIDERTRRPVAGAKVIYAPVGANARAADYYERDRLNCVETLTGTDGSFRLPGVPGRGWLMVYRTEPGLSAAERPVQGDTDRTDPPEEIDIFDGTRYSPAVVQALVAVDVDPKAPREYTITLDPGVMVRVTLTDPDGKPVTGAIALGMQSPSREWSKPLARAKFDVPAFNPDRPRPLIFYHPDRDLAVLYQPKKGDPGPWTVKLQPTASVTGTLVLPDGKPCPNAELTLSFTYPGQTDTAWLPNHPAEVRFKTDADGKFRLTKVIGDVDYVVGCKVLGDKGDEWTTIPFRAKPGETKDLGVVKTEPPRE